jgi:hypothetical protein
MRRNLTGQPALVVLLLAGLLGLTACRQQKPLLVQLPDPSSTAPTVTATPSASAPAPASASASATPHALRSQPPIQGCANGWKEPAPGTALRAKPLDLLRQSQRLTGTFQVVDLRYFTGPDDANLAADSKQSKPVERWYGKVIYAKNPAFRIRFLVVRRTVGEGIAAVASYGTKNFASPDWYGFDGEGGRSAYPTVPGRWPGQPYDYVEAHELPDEVVGCLAE